MPKQASKPLTPDQILDKMAKYCAYQERCVKDVRDKLKTFDLPQEGKSLIICWTTILSTMSGLLEVLCVAKSTKAVGE